MSALTLKIRLSGLRPLMFDRYPGDNSTQLPVAEKMYLDEDHRLILPSINLYSLLCSENTKSVTKLFFGKLGRTVALGISSYTTIDPFDIPIRDEKEHIQFTDFGGQITKHKAVARLAKGVPNPKERPLIKCPWNLEFDMEYQENKYCTLENLRQAFVMGGTLGLGTFRPFFGRYEVTQFG